MLIGGGRNLAFIQLYHTKIFFVLRLGSSFEMLCQFKMYFCLAHSGLLPDEVTGRTSCIFLKKIVSGKHQS